MLRLHHRHSVPSLPANKGLHKPNAEPNNASLFDPAKDKVWESKSHPMSITPNLAVPPRPPRHPKRPQSILHSPPTPSFHSRTDIHLGSDVPVSLNSPTDSSDALLSRVPREVPHTSSSQQTVFLNRIPKSIDDDSASTLSSIPSRSPSIRPLKSYKRPSTAGSDYYVQLSGGSALHSGSSLPIMDVPERTAEIRTRTKSKLVHSDAVFANRKGRSLNWNTHEKTATTSPLSLTETWSASQASLTPPVTASTLNDSESASSFKVFASPLEHKMESKQSNTSRKPFWGMKVDRSQKKDCTNVDGVLTEPKRSRFVIWNCDSSSRVVVAEQSDEKMQTVTASGSPHRFGGTVRNVWRSIMSRT